MRNLKIMLMLVALVGLIAVAGCGGSDSSSTSSSTTASDTTATDSTATDSTSTSADSGDYATQLTTILTDFGTSFQTLGTKLQNVKDEKALASGIDELESQIQTTITDLKALTPPPEAQAGQDKVIAAFEAFSGKLTDVSDAVASGDASAATTAAKDLQAAASTFQTDFTAGITEIAQSGVNVGPGTGG
jgi:TolA-binding protein